MAEKRIDFRVDVDGHLVWITLTDGATGEPRTFLGRSIISFSPYVVRSMSIVHTIRGDIVVNEPYHALIRIMTELNGWYEDGM